ncbi:hypothetical protein [Laspinema olomoucense]|uniref:hypothetical protein n=1 Tax=Laspinema olomoucense TaxID=3231600 RepID=UPI0021BB2DB7|nr:hypothetical protein [Laspinema sp. D3d]MCT7971255.1 hypothetical protein [Laspinema sp. D3d]
MFTKAPNAEVTLKIYPFVSNNGKYYFAVADITGILGESPKMFKRFLSTQQNLVCFNHITDNTRFVLIDEPVILSYFRYRALKGNEKAKELLEVFETLSLTDRAKQCFNYAESQEF